MSNNAWRTLQRLTPPPFLTPCRGLTLIKQVVPVTVANCPRSQRGEGVLYNTFFSERPPLPHFHLLSLHAVILPASSPLRWPRPPEIVPSSKTLPVHGVSTAHARPARVLRSARAPVSACAHFLISLVLVAAEQLQSMLSSYGRHSLPPAFQPDRNSFQVCISALFKLSLSSFSALSQLSEL